MKPISHSRALVAAMSVFVLAACGSKKNANDSNERTAGQTKANADVVGSGWSRKGEAGNDQLAPRDDKPSGGIVDAVHPAIDEEIVKKDSPQEKVVNKMGMNLLDVSTATTPQAFPLEATALTEIFKPVFGSTPRSVVRPVGTEYFNTSEAAALGATIGANPENIVGQSDRATAADFRYVVTLRAFLGDACLKAIRAEATIPVAQRKFVIDPMRASTGIEVSNVMTSFFGYVPDEGKLHAGAQQYADVFSADVAASAAKTDVEKRTVVQRNATLICVSVGSDPRTIFR